MIRDIQPEDLDYLIDAGKKYSELIGWDFDESIFVGSLTEYAKMPNVKFFIIPGKAHCTIALSRSSYGKDVMAKVVSTWGTGGITCLKEAKKWAKEQGATRIIADSNLSPKIAKVYKDMGMKRYDTNYMGTL